MATPFNTYNFSLTLLKGIFLKEVEGTFYVEVILQRADKLNKGDVIIWKV